MNTNNTIKKITSGISLVLLSIFVTSVSAQQEPDLFSLSLDELSQVKVTIANRTEESFIKAPASVTVITRREIEQLGVRTLNELLNYVPGFQSLMSPQDSNRSMILARGLSDVYGRHLLLMIDGNRINDEYTGGFTYANHLMSLYNVKQVEFIRGPGSALYGSNASSGVINIITGKQKQATLMLGSNNARSVSASTFGSAGERKSRVAINYYRDEGQNYSGLTDNSGFNKSSQDPVEVFEGQIDLEYGRNKVTLAYMATQLEDYYVNRRITNGVNKNDTSRLGIYFERELKLPSNWQGKYKLGAMRHDRQQQFVLSPSNPIKINSYWQQETIDTQVDFSYITDFKHQLSFGGYLGTMEIPVASNNFTNRFVLDKSRQIIGLYIQDQFAIIDNLRLTAGLRYDNYSDVGDSFNPRLALLYQWLENHSFKFMYGRAYRAPSLGDLYDTESITGDGNLFLDPVIVDSYEMAWLFSKNNNNVILTWFYNNYQDLIGTRTTTGNLVIFDNLYDNQIHGLELEFHWEINTNWSTRAGLTHIISNKTTVPSGAKFNAPVELAPATYGSLYLNYLRNNWNWNISTVGYNSISVMQNSKSLFIVNSKLAYNINRRWKVSANIRNLFDENYSTPQSRPIGTDESGNLIQEYPSRGREFFITANYSFGH
ncbi:MAG: TonB-dependent receptor plug domain-containing protein [Gammaproteobacteria bacterium]